MAEKGQVNIEHLGGVVRLREEHEKVMLAAVAKHNCWLVCNVSQAAVSHSPHGASGKVFKPRLGPSGVPLTANIDFCTLIVS